MKLLLIKGSDETPPLPRFYDLREIQIIEMFFAFIKTLPCLLIKMLNSNIGATTSSDDTEPIMHCVDDRIVVMQCQDKLNGHRVLVRKSTLCKFSSR